MGVCNTAPKGSRSNYLLTGMILQVFHLPFQPPGALVPNRTARPMASWIFRRTSPSVPRSGWFPSSADTRRFDIHGMGGKSGIWCEGTGTWKIVESKWRWSCFVFFFHFFFWEGEGGSCFFLGNFSGYYGEAMKACYNKDDEGLKVFGKRNGSNIALSLNCLKLH